MSANGWDPRDPAPLRERLFLIERTETTLRIMDRYPPDCAIPDPGMLLNLALMGRGRRTIMAFNIKHVFCYSWSFSDGSGRYAVVIATSWMLPRVYLDFLREVAMSPGLGEAPSLRFAYVEALIRMWDHKDGALSASFPRGLVRYSSEDLMDWPATFPSVLPLDKIERIWLALVTEESLLLLAESPEDASMAVMCALALLWPIRYGPPFALILAPGAPKPQDGVRLAGACSDAFNTSFSHVICITTRHASMWHVEEQRAKTTDLFKRLRREMDAALLVNPFADALALDIVPPELDEAMARRISRGATVRHWRERIMFRAELRHAMLSCPPATLAANPDRVGEMLTFLRSIRREFPTDRQLLAVTARHELNLRKRRR